MKNVIILSMLFALSLLAGCSQLRGTAESPGNATAPNSDTAAVRDTAPGPPEFAPTADPRSDVEKMSERFLGLTSFKARMTSPGPTPMSTEMEFVAPDRYRIRSSSAMEMIVVGRATYMKVNDRWQQMALPLDSTITDIRAAFSKEGMRWFDNVKYAGEENLAGKPAYVYTYRGKGPEDRGENESKLWVSKTNGLPLKVEAVFRNANNRSMTIEYDYDTQISIEAPADARPARGGYNYPNS